MTKFSLTNDTVKKNIESMQNFMKKDSVDYFYVSSFDQFLNEYVPMKDCHRYYVTGFSGSVAEALVPQSGKVKLYVDGRYHEQADLECDSSLIDVVKVSSGTGLIQSLKNDLKNLAPKNIAIEADRTPLQFFQFLDQTYTVKSYLNQELAGHIDFVAAEAPGKITQLDDKTAGCSVEDKLKRVLENQSEAYFVSAIDSLAWITNCRGYHLPNLSSFLGRGLVTSDKIYVFIDKGVEFEATNSKVEFINCDAAGMGEKLKEFNGKYNFKKVSIDPQMLNTLDYILLEDVFSKDTLVSEPGGLVWYQSIKTDGELEAFRGSFKRSDKAIFNTIKWVKDSVAQGTKISELDLYNQTTVEYKKQGAVEQSFGTISGVGANGSIIHYSSPKSNVYITEDDMILLDSGGYFESGFATDTTRTFSGGTKELKADYKKIYTLVLKGTLALQNAIFKEGTLGGGLDAICRQPLYQAGYDYAHGTGHGVGVHVHESGVRIGPGNHLPMKAGQVVSIEPGIYIPGFGGVRIENIGIVKEDTTRPGFLCFESLVYIGYEPNLIDEALYQLKKKLGFLSMKKFVSKEVRVF